MAGQFLNLMGNESLHSLTGSAQPDKACPEILPVQRAGMKGCPQQRKACRQHPPCEFVERAAQRRNLLRGAREPVEDCLDSIVFRALVRRPLHNVTGQQISWIDADHRRLVCIGHDQSLSDASHRAI